MSTFLNPPEGGHNEQPQGPQADTAAITPAEPGATAEPAGGGVDVEWEMSKENVLPLARGRKVESIRRAFGGPASCAQGAGEVETPGGGGGAAEVRAALKRLVTCSLGGWSVRFAVVG